MDNKGYPERKKQYLVDCINTETPAQTEKEKVLYLAKRFKQDYLSEYELKRNGYSMQKTLEEYIKGLPSCLSIDFYNHDILCVEEKLGGKWNKDSEEEEWLVIESWFPSLARIAMQLFDKYNITLKVK